MNKVKAAIHRSFNDILQLFYPHICIGCGSDVIRHPDLLCVRCYDRLPFSLFIDIPGNPVERTFYGRIQLEQAAALFYFSKQSIVQNILFELKYRGNKKAGLLFGDLIGKTMNASDRFKDIDMIIPMPLNEKKLQQRGYNQAELIAEGIEKITGIPVKNDQVVRTVFTDTQTGKGRISRWQTMEGVFKVSDPSKLAHKHILIVDDVITTGATIEAMVNALGNVPGIMISVIAAAWTAS